MCGIAGTIGTYDDTRAAALVASLRHRGPDSDPTIVSNERASIGAVRLSIVDAKRGDQPMHDKASGNIVALNGEIYNYRQLRTQLRNRGQRFNTNCDTEVVLQGLQVFGPRFVRQLQGIFAIAFYSSADFTLYLFRDTFGVKPIYYTLTPTGLEFASEAKSFLLGRGTCRLDSDFIIYNKILGCSPPERSIFADVKAVIPGTYLKYVRHTVTSVRFSPDITITTPKSFLQAVTFSRDTLIKAVQAQIPREVPWGVLLSGGIDSSILASICRNSVRQKLTTFTVGPRAGITEDVLSARAVAKFLGTHHIEIKVGSANILDAYADYIYSIEDINPKFFFYYFLSKFISRSIKVALCGEGADELYAGYPVYRNVGNFSATIQNRCRQLGHLLSVEARRDVEQTIRRITTGGFRTLYSFMIRKQLPYFQLNIVDKCSMQFGVEFRVPYLHLPHAINVQRYPQRFLLHGAVEKDILRTAFSGTRLPTLRRPKVFAGTRTLPRFYATLTRLATRKYPTLIGKYSFGRFLDPVEIFSLDLLVERMIHSVPPVIGRHNRLRL